MHHEIFPRMPTQKRDDQRRSEVSLVRQPTRKTDRLLSAIRRLALKQQTNQPQVFLSLRDAAERFGVPVSAMAVVYKTLGEERLLTSIRGSHTMLSACGAIRNLKVRDLIGLPVSLSRFQTFL